MNNRPHEISQLALACWAYSRKPKHVGYVWNPNETKPGVPLRQWLADGFGDEVLLMRRWLNRTLRWDWFMGPWALWECGIEPYASNPYISRARPGVRQLPRKPIFSENTHEKDRAAP